MTTEPFDHLLENDARLVVRVQIDGIHADGSVVPVTRGDAFVLTD